MVTGGTYGPMATGMKGTGNGIRVTDMENMFIIRGKRLKRGYGLMINL
jgi:hypothetical protein